MTYEQARELAPGTGLLVNISGNVVCRTQAGSMNVCPSTPVNTTMMGAPAPYNPHLAGGKVVKQEPGAGTPVRKGYTLTVAVERAISNCMQMPRVIGLDSSHAALALRNHGFAAVKTQLLSTREKNAPVRLQTPREGSWVWPPCTEVSLGL